MLWKGDARGALGIEHWPFRDCCAGRCFKFLDFIDGHDKEVVVEPEEAGIEARRYFYWDVHEEAAILAVPDSNGFACGCRDSIALRRVFRCYHAVLVVDC